MKPVTIQPGTQPRSLSLIDKTLLLCGILAGLLYILANIVTPIMYKGYHVASQTVSELSAIDAPTRSLWIALMIPYSIFIIAFGYGILRSSAGNRKLRIVGILLIVEAVIGFFWPPMHQREVLAAGGGTISDTLHIVWTAITVPMMMLAIGLGGFAFGKTFRIYSILTLVTMIVAGIFTGIDSPHMQANLPTPWMGIWERITIAPHMIWLIVFAILLLNKKQMVASTQIKTTSIAA